jgi:hypothetical protein
MMPLKRFRIGGAAQAQRHHWGIDTIAMVAMWHRQISRTNVQSYPCRDGVDLAFYAQRPSLIGRVSFAGAFGFGILCRLWYHEGDFGYYAIESMIFKDRRCCVAPTIMQNIKMCLTSFVSFRFPHIFFTSGALWNRLIFAAKSNNKSMVYVVAPKELHAHAAGMEKWREKQKGD